MREETEIERGIDRGEKGERNGYVEGEIMGGKEGKRMCRREKKKKGKERAKGYVDGERREEKDGEKGNEKGKRCGVKRERKIIERRGYKKEGKGAGSYTISSLSIICGSNLAKNILNPLRSTRQIACSRRGNITSKDNFISYILK